ncbi:MAG: hypothetical protein Q7J78_06690 [Clostridiales bacterium]|nr:hypothetical protein [Clostridiales bacterium]
MLYIIYPNIAPDTFNITSSISVLLPKNNCMTSIVTDINNVVIAIIDHLRIFSQIDGSNIPKGRNSSTFPIRLLMATFQLIIRKYLEIVANGMRFTDELMIDFMLLQSILKLSG